MEMKINILGNALFSDLDFVKSLAAEPEWKNFKQKIKNEKNINMESVFFVDQRASEIIEKILKLSRGIKNEEDEKDFFQNQIKEFSDNQKIVLHGTLLIRQIIFDFFEQLKLNITNFLPCDIPQNKIVQYTFAKHLNMIISYPFNDATIIKGRALKLRRNEKKCKEIESFLKYFFKKNNENLYEATMDNANEDIKAAFKAQNKEIDDLKCIVDTDRGMKLSKPSTSWKTLKKVLDNCNGVFDGIDKNSVISYKESYFIYVLLKNFEKVIYEFIPQILYSKIIEDILKEENLNYLKSLRDYYIDEEIIQQSLRDYYIDEKIIQLYKIPETAMEYVLYEDKKSLISPSDMGYFINGLDLDYFYYDKDNPDAMKFLLNYGSQEKYIDYIFNSRIGEFRIKKYSFDENTFNKEIEEFFLEKICCEDKIGKSSDFFFKWYQARIKNLEYQYGNTSIDEVSLCYLDAYNCGLYFAGKYTKKFIKEAIEVFLEEYKLTKKTGRVKEIYQYATALGVTMQLYKQFKDANFEDSAINPYEFFIKMWDYGYDVVDIAKLTGLYYQEVQKILIDNKKFLKRNDEKSIAELGRYISKWECDEYGIDTFECWD